MWAQDNMLIDGSWSAGNRLKNIKSFFPHSPYLLATFFVSSLLRLRTLQGWNDRTIIASDSCLRRKEHMPHMQLKQDTHILRVPYQIERFFLLKNCVEIFVGGEGHALRLTLTLFLDDRRVLFRWLYRIRSRAHVQPAPLLQSLERKLLSTWQIACNIVDTINTYIKLLLNYSEIFKVN